MVTLLAGAGLFVGGAAALISVIPDAQRLVSYDMAPQCAAMSDAMSGASCRFSGSARVLIVFLDDSVRLQPLAANGRQITARLPHDPPVTLQPGDTVSVEVWAGKALQVGGELTIDNPTFDGGWETLAVIGLMLVPIGLGVIVWGVRTWRRPEDDLDAPSLAPISTGGTLFNQ